PSSVCGDYVRGRAAGCRLKGDLGWRLLRLGYQFQGDRVDAVALVGRGRVALAFEDVPEVAVAGAAEHLDPLHAHRAVFAQQHRVRIGRVVERRPATVALELRVAAEQLGTARAALVDAGGLGVGVLTGERPLGPRLAEHGELVGAELRPPFLLGLHDARGGADN